MNTQSNRHTLADRLLGIAMLLLAIAYGYGAQQFEEPFGMAETIGPEAFPTILSVILGLAGLALIVKPHTGQRWPDARTWLDMIAVLAALIVFALILEPVGFIIAATLFSFFVSWRMSAKPVKAFIIGFCYSIGLFLLFNYGLDLSLPAGWLGGIL